MIIIVTGTPGTGKTTLAKKICKESNLKYLDVNKVVKKEKLSEGYDKKRKTKIVDEKKLAKALEKTINEFRKAKKSKFSGLIIDSHLSYYINPKHIDLCIVTKCNLKELKQRLKKKGYNKEKIDENMECEIMDICLNEAKESGHKTFIVDTSRNNKKKERINKILNSIK